MNIAVLGTGMVGRAHADRLHELGNTVIIGTRDKVKILNESQPDAMGNPPFNMWYKDHPGITLDTFSNAAKNSDIIIVALNGAITLEVLKSIKTELTGKVIMDITNPLDFSAGMPPSLFVSNTDSLAEQIQRELPDSKVVKTLNTTNAFLQVDPKQLENGNHTIFVSGNDQNAKNTVKEILKNYGWSDILDLGDITTARGVEMLLPLWLRLWGAL